MKKIFVTTLVIALISIFSAAILAQGKGNRSGNAETTAPRIKKPKTNPIGTNGAIGEGASDTVSAHRSSNSNNAPAKPCNQLTGDDLLVKGRKCTLPNGQVTTVGKYCDDYGTEACRQSQNRRNGKAGSEEIMARPNSNIQSSETEGIKTSTNNSNNRRSKPKIKIRPRQTP